MTELVRLKADGETKIEYIENVPVLRLRNELLPLVYLSKILKQKNADEDSLEKNSVIMVTKIGSCSFGIIVDRVFDTEEIVVKPVSSFIRDIPIYAGNTILGDGSVIMILDANGIAEMVGELALSNAHKDDLMEEEQQLEEEQSSVLIFSAGAGAQKAVPLSLISRLEEFNSKDIETSNNNYLIQYREKIMPLFPLDKRFDVASSDTHPVLVFSKDGNYFGLIVETIRDIVQIKIDIQMSDTRAGIIGNCIINDITTDFLDTNYYLAKASPNWFEAEALYVNEDFDKGKPTILFVEDSAFFRNLIQPEIESSGYNVVAVETSTKALKVCQSERYHFDAIIIDIEMPGMNGFEFARELKNISKYKETPLLALSNSDNPAYVEEGNVLGFVDCFLKKDEAFLSESLESSLSTLFNKVMA